MLNGSVTVDHRLLSESGRAEIVKEQEQLIENFRQSAENLAKALPDGVYKDKALETLNNVQAKLVNMPVEMKAGGAVLEQAYPEYIRQGGEPKDFERMFNDPETLQLIKEANDYAALKDRAVTQLVQQGYSREQANNTVQSLEQQSNQIKNDDIPTHILDTITLTASKGIILPNAKNDQATYGSEVIDVKNTTNTLIEVVTRAGQIKQKVDQKIEESNINPQYVGLAFGLVLGGPANLAQSMLIDYLAGDKIEEIREPLKTGVTAELLQTDGETVNTILANKDTIKVSGNDTAQQLVDQLQWTKDGVGVVSDIVLGAAGGVIAGKVAKGKDVEQTSTSSPSQSREELTKPYDPKQVRTDLEATYGAENVSSTTIPAKPHQANSNRADVVIDGNGGKAVQITLEDGSSKMIPYDNRGLAIFDDVVVFTTKIDNTKSYSSQMSQASKDMWNVIKDDPVAQSKFTSKQLKALEAGRARVPGYTWHHNAQSSPNNMQLVPDSIHSNKTVPHTGQNSLTNSDK